MTSQQNSPSTARAEPIVAYESQPSSVAQAKRTKIRYLILFTLFLVSTLNYADRATLSITGTQIQKEMGISAVEMGYIFSSFAWAYVMSQLPGGILLDRFGTKIVYGSSIFLWSLLTALQGGIGFFTAGTAVIMLFCLRFLVGVAEAPAFPGNSRMASSWFPSSERGTAAAIFNASQYFAAVIFTPLMGWITHTFGWHYVFVVMGAIGIVFSFAWKKIIYSPTKHPWVNKEEVSYISEGGALIHLEDQTVAARTGSKASSVTDESASTWVVIKQLLSNRMMLGILIAQYCITVLTYFFLTWFPIYLVQERGMTILQAGFVTSIPAIFGFLGGVLGGVISDYMLKKGLSTSVSRKVPIVFGLLLSTSIMVCNYVSEPWMVVAIMAMAFFGKGVGALGWAVVSDVAPKKASGVCGALFNTFGNTAGITTPIVIGYIVGGTGSFSAALVFVGVNAIIAVTCYVFVVGKIQRLELR